MPYLMNRNYAAAKKLLAEIPEPKEVPRYRRLGMPNKLTAEIMTYWLLGDSEKLDALVDEARAYLEAYQNERGAATVRACLGMALLAAVEGNADETERLVRRFDRTGGLDWPERVGQRDIICQILAISGAAEAAVDCIRIGLEEPSYVAPFLDPLWPFYDAIRNEPVFVELVAELEESMDTR